MRPNINMPAASLPVALVVSTLMLLSVAGFFILFDNTGNEISRSRFKLQQTMNLESAVLMYCKDSTFTTKLSADGTIRLYEGNETSDVRLTVSGFGLYEKVRAASVDDRFVKTAIVGSANMGYNDASFYVPNRYSPLSITGNTVLEGKVYVPAYGVSYNQMNYRVFSGEKIRPENIRTAEPQLPATIERSPRSFETDLITVTEDMFLEDTVLAARIITIESGFTGTVQLMASDTVIVESDVILKYPSGIHIIKGNNRGYVEIKGNSIVNGYVVIEKGDTATSTETPNLRTDAASEIRGVVYVDGISHLQGTVTGMVFSDEFAFFAVDGTYRNTVHDLTVIENKKITAPLLIEDAPYERKIIKWLD